MPNKIINVLHDVTNATRGVKFEIIKVTGTEKETRFNAMVGGGSIVMKAVTKEPVAEFDGVFGLNNIDILRGYLDIYKSYDETTTVETKMRSQERNGVEVKTDIQFSAKGQSSANYRLTGQAALPKVAVLNDMNWDVSLDNISKGKISQFTRFAGVLGGTVKNFLPVIKNGKLVFEIGDSNSSVSVAEVEMGEVVGTLNSSYAFPIVEFLTVFVNNNPCIRLSNRGILMVEFSSELANYQFTFMGSNR
jgi:hypothetical protein